MSCVADIIPTASGNSMTVRAGVFMVGMFYGLLAAWNMCNRQSDLLNLALFAFDTCNSSIADTNYGRPLMLHASITLVLFSLCFLHFTAFFSNTYIAPIDWTHLGVNVHKVTSVLLLHEFVFLCLCFVGCCFLVTAWLNQLFVETEEEEHEE